MKKNIIMMALAGLLLGFSSCNKEIETETLSAEIAQLDPDTENEGGKNYFHNEHFIYWEEGDKIAVGSNAANIFTLESGANTQTAVFFNKNGEAVIYKNRMVAVYPDTCWRQGEKLFYPATMPYRQDSVGGMSSDLTFGKNCFPMVSCLTKSEVNHEEKMTFHSVSGILRVGLFSNTVSGTITSIDIESVDGNGTYTKKQISGEFEIQNVDKYNPYLKAKLSPAAADYKISITNINKTIGAGAKEGNSNSNLWTFYIPLPAQTEIEQAASTENLTLYALKITVHTNNGDFSKNFGAKIRRNALSKMQVIEIDKLEHSTGQDNVHMVGNGTQLRPFQIYYGRDLWMVRDAINNGKTINGQQIDQNTYFKVVRSDIRLIKPGTDSTRQGDVYWGEGIKDFKGHFMCSSGHPTRFGIENASSMPLFESVNAQGKLDSVTVYGTSSYNGTADFCPLVKENNGKMSNCVNKVKVTGAQGNLAGVCFTNNGTLHGCRNEANLTTTGTTGQVAGVCFQNNNIVLACVVTGSKLRGSAMGGVVMNNAGEMNSCSASFNDYEGNCPAGLVVYSNTNSGSTVQNSLCSGHYSTTAKVGGVCYENTGNVLDCRNVMSELAGATRVGGVVCDMTGGEVRNSYTECPYLDNSGSAAITIGGLVGYVASGIVANCYVNGDIHPNNNAGNTYVGAVVGQVDGGTFWNSYSTIGRRFYGTVNATANPSYDNCFHFFAAAQTGISTLSVSSSDIIMAGNTTLLSKLNGWSNLNSSNLVRYTEWTASNGTHNYPMLKR